jgi:hypothetical protein
MSTFNDLPIDIAQMIIDTSLTPYTWLGLYRLSSDNGYPLPSTYMCKVTVDDIICVQELKTLSRKFRRAVTQWFMQEWNAPSWAVMFRKFAAYSNVDLHTCAKDYFAAITNHNLFWNQWGENRGDQFRISSSEGSWGPFYFTIIVIGDICRVDLDKIESPYCARLTACWDIKTGSKVDPRPICGVDVDCEYRGEVLRRLLPVESSEYDDSYEGWAELTMEGPIFLHNPCWVNPKFDVPEQLGYEFRWNYPIKTPDLTLNDGSDIAGLF